MPLRLFRRLRAVLVVLTASCLTAEYPPVKSWTSADGLAGDSEIGFLLQDSRGYLWIGGALGLSRFDGHAFRNYGKADGLPSEIVYAGVETKDGTLWFGTAHGLVRYVPDAGAPRRFAGYPFDTPDGREIHTIQSLVTQGYGILMTFLATWIMSRIEKRPIRVYGLGSRSALPNFLSGLTSGAACLSLLVFVLWKDRLLAFDGRLMSGAPVLGYGAIWIIYFLLVGVLQEYLSRGYILFTITRGLAGVYGRLFKTSHRKVLGFWTASLLTSVLFGLSHRGNPGESPIGLLCAGLVGVAFCFSLWRSGSLWWAIGFHTSWDWAESFVFGVADSGLMIEHHLLATHPLGNPLMSGGATGPEGSLFALPILAITALIIIFTVPRARAVYPRSDQPGLDQPGLDQPGLDQPGLDQPGSDQPGSDQPGSDQPGSDRID